MKIIVSFVIALGLLGTLAIEAAAQSSCSAEHATCRSRCGKQVCPYCESQLASCKRTGCWQYIPQYGGQRVCGLKKS